MPKRRNFSSERFRLFLCIPHALTAHPNHRERGCGDVRQTGAGGVCRLAAGICGGAVPVVSAGAAPRLCCTGGSAEHSHITAARPAGKLLRCAGAAAHWSRGALAGGMLSRAGQLRPPVCLHRCRRAGAFVPQPQPCGTLFAGGKLRPRSPWADRLSRRSAVCRSAAVSASAGLSGWYRPRRCRAGKGAGRRTFRHRGEQQPCLRRDGAGYAAHRRNG